MDIISHPHNTSTTPRSQDGSIAEVLMDAAAQAMFPFEKGKKVATVDLWQVMTASFGDTDTDTDTEGLWLRKDAYEVTEAVQVLFLRNFGPSIASRTHSPQLPLTMLTIVALLVPTYRRRSEESQALQQFSTPIPLAYVASRAAGITPADTVLEPSAGTGLRAIFAELADAHPALNEYRVELADFTNGMRDWLPSIGLFSKMINWKLRFSVPVTDENPEMLSRLMERHRLVDVARRS